MKIMSSILQEGPSIYYDTAFRAVLEDHVPYFRLHPTTRTLNVPPEDMDKYRYDLEGYLTEIQIPPYLHCLVLRCSGYRHSTEFDGTNTMLTVPNLSEVDRIRQKYLTTHII